MTPDTHLIAQGLESRLHEELSTFAEFGERTVVDAWRDGELEVPVYVNEYWTSKQRQANSLHEVSYRACFKPQLPRFFIDRLTAPGDVVFDPFMGRGTTPIEAALSGRIPWGSDANPLAKRLAAPRLSPPSVAMVSDRLVEINGLCMAKFDSVGVVDDLLAFYHPNTLRLLCGLREYLLERESSGELDAVDAWIRTVATNRLTGHSTGFFSVYTLPPNQAVSVERQARINTSREQTPPERDIFSIIEKKSRQLLRGLAPEDRTALASVARESRMETCSADSVAEHLPHETVSLVVTSPPFLDVVQYAQDNWLRCWFNGIESSEVAIWHCRKVEDWQARMRSVLEQCQRLLKPGGWIAFEVGEVRKGSVLLEEFVVRAGVQVGLSPVLLLINQQDFTKTANCWGVRNNARGTNTNRIVLFRKTAGNNQLTAR
ncbi:MAG: DNA methyltransferase [Verrucomicrobiota bacterium]